MFCSCLLTLDVFVPCARQIIQRSGIKYTCKIKPHSCPLHDNGPVWELQLKRVIAQLAKPENLSSTQVTNLKQRQRELTTKVRRYELHLKQYSVCREAMHKAEEALTFGDRKCVVYRDFVNCYNEKGQKVKNLVLVKITRGEDGELVVVKINNFSTDLESGCDSYYMADVYEHHFTKKALGGSGHFDDVDDIIMSGDHGIHTHTHTTHTYARAHMQTRLFIFFERFIFIDSLIPFFRSAFFQH